MPFGAGVVLATRRRPASLIVATIGAAALSFAGEASQLYSHGRFPSATDVVCNTGGAALAAYLTMRRDAKRDA
jgi:VanZ family protein